MARAAVTIKGREIVGDEIAITLHVIFFGSDMAAPDATIRPPRRYRSIEAVMIETR